MIIIIIVFRHYPIDFEKEEQRLRAKKDLEGTELMLLKASLVSLGGSALWASGTGKKMLRRTMAHLPQSAGYACLAGAVAGALTATRLWTARRTECAWDTFRVFRSPATALAAASLLF
jgi:hypothetical protein